MIEKNDLLLEVCNIAIKAGEEILKYYNEDIEFMLSIVSVIIRKNKFHI